MTAFIVRALRSRGMEPVIAYYQPYSLSPELSVPLFMLLSHGVHHEQRQSPGACETHAIGAWLPELEFTHYFAIDYWRRLMDSCDAFVAVSGNALAATPFMQTGRPYLAWVASDWAGDRKDRVRRFSGPRKILDRIVNGPTIKRFERRILESGRILALSNFTAATLRKAVRGALSTDVLPMPVDTRFFAPCPESTVRGRIGFTGRLDDPRKNIELLLDAMSLLKQRGAAVTAMLIGGKPTTETLQQSSRLGLEELVHFVPALSPEGLLARLQSFDVFALSSHQEGLCISALEAMACGVPVVSTRCGGPEEFVVPGQTGSLVNFDASEMAQAILDIVEDRRLRCRLSTSARDIVAARYNQPYAEGIFWNAFDSTFPDLHTNRRND